MNANRGLKGFRGEAQLGTWLFRIARNVAMTMYRKRYAHDIVSIEKLEKEERSGKPAPMPVELQTNPERDYDDEEEFRAAKDALIGRYPREIQAAVLARECKDAAQAAEIAGCTIGTFYTRKSRGCALINDWIQMERKRRVEGKKDIP